MAIFVEAAVNENPVTEQHLWFIFKKTSMNLFLQIRDSWKALCIPLTSLASLMKRTQVEQIHHRNGYIVDTDHLSCADQIWLIGAELEQSILPPDSPLKTGWKTCSLSHTAPLYQECPAWKGHFEWNPWNEVYNSHSEDAVYSSSPRVGLFASSLWNIAAAID